MPVPVPTNPDPFRRLEAIMEALLSPEGCPWDREQTHESLRPYVIEEAHEVAEAIAEGDIEELRKELGDLGLQIVFHAALARRAGTFTLDSVYEAICEKLIRRHPHVFGDTNAGDAAAVLKNWEAIKQRERQETHEENGGKGENPSALDGVPVALPALQRAQRLQAKASRVGFDWKDVAPVFGKLREEIDELEEAAAGASQPGSREVAGELGDLLFAMVNLARFLEVDPEQALQDTNRKFLRRFRHVEERLREQGKAPRDVTLEEMDALWDEAKSLRK